MNAKNTIVKILFTIICNPLPSKHSCLIVFLQLAFNHNISVTAKMKNEVDI